MIVPSKRRDQEGAIRLIPPRLSRHFMQFRPGPRATSLCKRVLVHGHALFPTVQTGDSRRDGKNRRLEWTLTILVRDGVSFYQKTGVSGFPCAPAVQPSPGSQVFRGGERCPRGVRLSSRVDTPVRVRRTEDELPRTH